MVKGLDKMRAQLKAVPADIRVAVVAAMEKSANEVVREMKAAAPRGKTLKLVKSIGWTWGDVPKGSVTVGKVAGNEYSRLAIKIYAGGSEGTARKQAKSSGSRPSDQKRSGTFDADNAKYQEFGTSKMAANPFFFPVYRSNKPRIKGRITRAITGAVKKRKT